MIKLDPWLTGILANPITKIPTSPNAFPYIDGVIDARIFLKNTHGYDDCANGQTDYEQWADSDCTTEEQYKKEIDYDRLIYSHYLLSGRILDCGGAGTVREFLAADVEFVYTDPWLFAPFANSNPRKST